MRFKVVNRHGMKVRGHDAGFACRADADATARALNERGYDDAPFTVLVWGERQSFFDAEGHQETDHELGIDEGGAA